MRTVVVNLPGYSINDMLDTDFDTLISVLSPPKKTTKKNANRKVHTLAEFIEST